jgi:hypothetical protein
MQQALEILLQLRQEGILAKFAIGGAIAASFYAEAVATEDLDVFAFLSTGASGLISLSPLYERLEQLGGIVKNEHIVIGGWPVQVLPAYTPLVEQAIETSVYRSFGSIEVPVVRADYLCGIALQTGRAKDYTRVNNLISSGSVDIEALAQLVKSFHLEERWATYVRRFP